ncbi:homoserine kinase [Hymenobacter sp. 15J16-1T3B]|uniref:homoserine kinase n=1 Tax=Hymenobacter sp. 15J16-1T3B TaxID=2886941 RepID=UPI001D109B1A|nr:homoserine kinase [Hymenobacter sp. 15J16-1T3B]MCC3156007.1 homoserine kinase [Hymenobacter sp. 15J16-1T3B]
MPDSVRVFAPATVANLVCGFDVLGLAVERPGDEVRMTRRAAPGVRVTRITGDDGRLPLAAERNTVSASVQMLLRHLGRDADFGVDIELHKQMPIGSGLGSSAASTVAGLWAINELLGRPLTPLELLPFAMQGEELACGTGHADNVAPALLGGVVLIRSYAPLEVVRLPAPPLHCAIVYPHVEVATRDARQLIRRTVPLHDAVTQWGNVAGLVSGLFLNDIGLIGRSMQDVLVEPVRAMLIPDFYRLRELAMHAGAVGFGISGSGPSVFAFAPDEATAAAITEQLQRHLAGLGVGSEGYVSAVNQQGPRVID